MVLIPYHNFPHPSINSLPVIPANTNASCLVVSSPLSYTNCTFLFLLSIFFLSLCFFFLPPKARPLLMFPREQRGELPNRSSLVFTSWTVNVTRNQIVSCSQPLRVDIYASVTGEPRHDRLETWYRWSVGAAARRLPHKS